MEKEREGSENEVFEEPGKGPIKVILGVGLILLIVAMVIPFSGLKHNPEPSVVIEYALADDNSEGTFDGLYDVYEYPVSSEIKSAANKIATEGCNSGIKMCQIKALVYFVRDRIDYVSDPEYREYIQTPEATLYSGAGDCEDKSVLLVGLLKAIGVNAEIVTKPGHAYNRIYYPEAPKKYLEDGWIYVDTTCSRCGLGEVQKIV
ncbi:transglutaminase-like domain-containing protein [Candidatus Woesearchaeota archaeon]|nr:transglutaminase-like domain-containing protein [Candidatus Woesearchaeota archaeon]MBW3022010.1 transglutaminase-like domain-containing protein [Candidatus Woesearchaeota archaeon]